MNHADLNYLLILQEMDARIAKLRKELNARPEQRARLRQQMEGLKLKALKACQIEASMKQCISDVEDAVAAKRAYIVKMKTLQSNTRKNEEYQMCIREIEKTEAVIEELENKELELMAQLEIASEDFKKKSQQFQIGQQELEETLARFDRTNETDNQLLANLLEERTRRAVYISDESLEEYNRMLKSKGVPVIVEMDDKGHCGGCHMVLTDHTRMKVQGGHETVYCDNCQRILH